MENFGLFSAFRKIGYVLLILLIFISANVLCSGAGEEEVVVPENATKEIVPEEPTQETEAPITVPEGPDIELERPSVVPESSLVSPEREFIKASRPVSLKGDKVKIENIAQEIKSGFGVNLILKTGVAGQRLDINVTTDDLLVALDSICAPNGWVWVKDDEKTYSVMTRKEYEDTILPKQVEKKVYKLVNISATDADRILRPLATPRIGKIYGDPRTNKLFVEDLPNVISEIEYILKQIDVKLVTRVFFIKHADVADLATKLDTYRSETGEIQVDAKTRQIIVTDKMENIRKMEAFIETVDIGTELRVFEINNLTQDEQGALLEILQNIVTENALLYNDERSGTVIVDDVPEILEKVQKIIEAYDKPNKQVLISADIVQTILTDNLSLGVDYDVSKDMFKYYDAYNIGNHFWDEDGNVVGKAIDYHDLFPYFVLSGNTTTIDYLSKHIRAKFQAIANDKNTQILLSPRIQVKNHEEATIEVGKGVPFLTRYFDTEGRVTSEQPSVVRAGLKFGITPHIMNNDFIEMEVSIRNNDARVVEIKGFQSQPVSAVEEDTQEAETILLIPNNGTRVIGGLVSTTDTNTASGLPFLYKIPVLGELLFGSRSKANTRNNILLFITPSVVDDRRPKEKLDEFYAKELEKTKESKEKTEAEYIETKLTPEKIREKFGIPSEKKSEVKPIEKKAKISPEEKGKELKPVEKKKTEVKKETKVPTKAEIPSVKKEVKKTPAPKPVPTPTPKAELVKQTPQPSPTPVTKPTPTPETKPTPQIVKETPIPSKEEEKPLQAKEKEITPKPKPTSTPAPILTQTPIATSAPLPTPVSSSKPTSTPSSIPTPTPKTTPTPITTPTATPSQTPKSIQILGSTPLQPSVSKPIPTPTSVPAPVPELKSKQTLTPTPQSSPKPEGKREIKPGEKLDTEKEKTSEKKERTTSYELGPVKGEVKIQYTPVPGLVITPKPLKTPLPKEVLEIIEESEYK